MNDKRTKIEIIAPSVEEAIEKGLQDLGVSHSEVDVEVLDEGSKGLFGLGNRQARVRLMVKTEQETLLPELDEHKISPAVQMETTDEESTVEPVPPSTLLDEDYVLEIARDVVKELLERMRVKATVTAEYGEAEDARSRIPVLVNVNGDDLSYLIGRHAETLNALQYISNLIISKEIGRSIPLIVDVEGYRSRRENQLRQLARRMADQAINSGRRQVLEPMPANERRIIHIELRNNPQVTTESIGEEPTRKVTILPA
jgi:spoIIIJ-associated protein